MSLVVALMVSAVAVEARTHGARRSTVPDIVARTLPAVVSINTRFIERDQFGQSVPTPGLGSGVIVDRRGYILTNAHVVEGAEHIKVGLADERSLTAKLVGIDSFTDLAVVKIDVKDAALPVVTLGDSTRLRIGETVIAIGNPLWIEGGPTVTVGVVSGLKRSMEQEGLPLLHQLIQTDAAINPGNSGGPLLDLNGRVVGINTALIPSAHGIGFAISINTARPVLAALIAGRRLVRQTLGVKAVSVTPHVASVNGLAVERGALILTVDTGGPGESAGLQAGDVITGVGGTAVRDLHQFHEALMAFPLGQMIDITVWRGDERLTLRPVLEEYR
jgi:serine protease Do